MVWNNLLWVGLGGAAGSALRYLCQRSWNNHFPYGTLIVNICGCFLIGLLWGWLQKDDHDTNKMLLMTGFCGGFTTFSAFTLESIFLLQDHKWAAWMAYTALSIFAGLGATFLGMKFTS